MSTEQRIVGLGAGGHARVVMDILQLLDTNVHALLDPDPTLHGRSVLGVPVVGGDDLLPSLVEDGYRLAFIGLGSSGDTGPRSRLYQLVRSHGLDVVDAVHPEACISLSASLGPGVTVMAGAIVNAAARLGENVIVNTGAIVEHDCVLGDHVHIATGATLGGGVVVGEGTHVGLGASVSPGVKIGHNSIVGAGAVVVDDVEDLVVVAGVPARVLRRHEPR